MEDNAEWVTEVTGLREALEKMGKTGARQLPAVMNGDAGIFRGMLDLQYIQENFKRELICLQDWVSLNLAH